ncbi:MAG: DNA-packaging protein [Sphingomicrobium sp.]
MSRILPGWLAALAELARRCGQDDLLWAYHLHGLPVTVRRFLDHIWLWQAHPGQQEPSHAADGNPWRCWLLMAGRGFGKTRSGAEWVHRIAASNPDARIALVADTRQEAVRVMVEGSSGILATAKGQRPRWSRTIGQIEWPSGAQAFVYSAEAAEALRGPEHDAAWCDELGKWGRSGKAAWDNLMLGLRRGEQPRVVVTTTPRPGPLLRRIHDEASTAISGGRTTDNAHLPPAFHKAMLAAYGGTRLGAQELDGRLIEAIEGSMFPAEVLERARNLPGGAQFKRIVVGVDPPASADGDACGIVVCAIDRQDPPCFHVLADCSVSGLRPEGWARAVANAAEAWKADRVIAEKNQGGDMVGAVLRGADCTLPVRLVHASRGKAARAEPVASLMEAGRVRLAGRFPELEEELGGLTAGGYEGPTRSPDRADACVWAISALIEGSRRGGPRILTL